MLIRKLFQKGYFKESNRYNDYPDFNHDSILSEDILLNEQNGFEPKESSSDDVLNLYCDVESQVTTGIYKSQ